MIPSVFSSIESIISVARYFSVMILGHSAMESFYFIFLCRLTGHSGPAKSFDQFAEITGTQDK